MFTLHRTGRIGHPTPTAGNPAGRPARTGGPTGTAAEVSTGSDGTQRPPASGPARRGRNRLRSGAVVVLWFPASRRAPLAQLAEQRTLNPRVRGSSPWRRTTERGLELGKLPVSRPRLCPQWTPGASQVPRLFRRGSVRARSTGIRHRPGASRPPSSDPRKPPGNTTPTATAPPCATTRACTPRRPPRSHANGSTR